MEKVLRFVYGLAILFLFSFIFVSDPYPKQTWNSITSTCNEDTEANARLDHACKEKFGDNWKDKCGDNSTFVSWGDTAFKCAKCSDIRTGAQGWKWACLTGTEIFRQLFDNWVKNGALCMRETMRHYLRCDQPLCK